MWYVRVNGGFRDTVTPDTSRGLNVKRASTSKAGSKTVSAANESPGPELLQVSTSRLRHAGSKSP
jgi:hypothetical protein